MGVNTYEVDLFKKPKKGSLPTPRSIGFSRYNRSSGDLSDFFNDQDDEYYSNYPQERTNRYIDEHTCRETLLEDNPDIYAAIFDSEEIGDYNKILGIRCTGEMYTTTSRILRSKKNYREIFSKFIEKVFNLNCEIRCGILKNKLRISYKNGSKRVDGFVTLYLPSVGNEDLSGGDLLISSILAILREPRIIKGILSGEINDKRSLCKELVKISVDRAYLKDSSYECFTLVSGYFSQSKKENLRYILQELNYPINGEGSDWLSIILLSIFIFEYDGFKEQLSFSGNGTGPADFILENSISTEFEKFKDFVEEDSNLSLLHNKLIESKYKFSFERYWDDLFEDTKIWAKN